MAVCTATFEAGVNGATITTSAGEASATAWDVVNLNEALLTYDNAHVASGSLSGHWEGTGASGGAETRWTSALSGPLSDYYFRIYLYITASGFLANFFD